jgi:hypothetical protein
VIASILADSWRLYCQLFGLIVAIICVVWVPCELFSSYLDAFVFDPENFRASFKLAQFLENFIGIIAISAVTYAALNEREGYRIGFGDAMRMGFSTWGRMWWARFLSTLVIVLGLLLLIIPGLYLGVRLCLAESIIVTEQTSGVDALKRSFELTKNRFWMTFRVLLIYFLIVAVFAVLIALPPAFIPVLDHWILDATGSWVAQLIFAFNTVFLLCAYAEFSKQPLPAEDALTSAEFET